MNESRDITGNPAPLGLLGFGMTTVLLNLHNAGFYELNAMILAMGICYGGIAQVIAGMMHLEVVGEYWDGLFEEVIRHYDAAGIDKGVVMNTWMPSREPRTTSVPGTAVAHGRGQPRQSRQPAARAPSAPSRDRRRRSSCEV